jgi:hypothetical protein
MTQTPRASAPFRSKWIWVTAGAVVGTGLFFSGRVTDVITDVTNPARIVFILRIFGLTVFTNSGPSAKDYPIYVVPILLVAFPLIGALLGLIASLLFRRRVVKSSEAQSIRSTGASAESDRIDPQCDRVRVRLTFPRKLSR